ncbi:tRNA dihydrouridine synthase DusB [Patescibacteria group bacterium]|nr:tRNA dihydrouridine synthase DusB [Patescibacteria group bacterium]MBU1448590.1 tRNA dihydrouridine synthase DusB [Patescibacteria group bacterium]
MPAGTSCGTEDGLKTSSKANAAISSSTSHDRIARGPLPTAGNLPSPSPVDGLCFFGYLPAMLDWKTLPRPIVALAPMADMTDPPFCRLCREVSGGDFVIFREMVSSEAVVRENPKTLRMCDIVDEERPVIQQIFGSDPSTMAEAARIVVERFRPDGIDINMGCPATKIVSNFDGAALMRDPKLAADIVRAVKAAVDIPVSVKTRLGWTSPTDIVEFSKVLEDAGADLVTVRGRTKAQGYAGAADWDAIGAARAVVKVPVLVNGDIVSVETAKQALATSGTNGIMIGRGALGNPWILGRLAHALADGVEDPDPTDAERVATVLRHAELHLAWYGERGLVTLRKHLPWYFKNEARFKELRAKLVRVSTMEELKEILRGT